MLAQSLRVANSFSKGLRDDLLVGGGCQKGEIVLIVFGGEGVRVDLVVFLGVPEEVGNGLALEYLLSAELVDFLSQLLGGLHLLVVFHFEQDPVGLQVRSDVVEQLRVIVFFDELLDDQRGLAYPPLAVVDAGQESEWNPLSPSALATLHHVLIGLFVVELHQIDLGHAVLDQVVAAVELQALQQAP